MREWIFDDERDSWGITREGRRVLDKARERFRAEWKVSECYLWTFKFKKFMDDSYVPSEKDRKRPDDELLDALQGL